MWVANPRRCTYGGRTTPRSTSYMTYPSILALRRARSIPTQIWSTVFRSTLNPHTSAVYIITPQSSILRSRRSPRHYNADTPATTTFRPIGGHKQGALTLKEVNDNIEFENCEEFLWEFLLFQMCDFQRRGELVHRARARHPVLIDFTYKLHYIIT